MDLGYLTGARPADLRALRWDQASGDRLRMRQTEDQAANGIRHDGRTSPWCLVARGSGRSLGLYVLARSEGSSRSHATKMSDAWLTARNAAGIPDAQFRDIRAMAAKAAKEGGQDFQALLGHTTRAMSEHYIKGRQTVVAEPV